MTNDKQSKLDSFSAVQNENNNHDNHGPAKEEKSTSAQGTKDPTNSVSDDGSDDSPDRTNKTSGDAADGSEKREIELSPENKEQLEAVENLLEKKKSVSLSESTVPSYLSAIKQYFRHLEVENIDMQSADVNDVRSFLEKAAQMNYRRGSLSLKYAAIKKAYKIMYYENEMSSDIDLFELKEMIEITNFRSPPPIERESLTDEELEKLKGELSKRNKLMVLVGVETGARNVDITKITLNRVNLDAQEIEMTDTKSQERYTMPISDTLAIELKHWIETDRQSFHDSDSNQYLFPSQKGGRLATDTFATQVKAAAERAGIQEELGKTKISGKHKLIFPGKTKTFYKVTPHALRHTFNVKLQKEAGLDAESRANALNQSSIETNKKHYSEESEEYRDALSNLFD